MIYTVRPSYNTRLCCGADCDRLGWDDAEPCWGVVDVVDEVECDDDDYLWTHACAGHRAQVEGGGAYEKEPGDQGDVSGVLEMTS